MATKLDLSLKMSSWDYPGGAGGGGPGAQVVFPAPLGPTSSVYDPTIIRGAVTVLPAFLAATGAVYNPTMVAGGQIVEPDFLAATGGPFNVTIDRGPVTVLPDFLAATGSVFDPTMDNPGGGGYSTEAQAYFTAFTTDPGTTRKDLLAAMIDGLVSDGVWPDIDQLYMLASHDTQSALLNVKNPAESCTTVNSPTFTTDLGYKGNGSTSYVKTPNNISGGAYGFVQNDCHIHVYCNAQTGAGTSVQLGQEGAAGRIQLTAHATAGSAQNGRACATTDVNIGNSTGTRKSWRAVTRSGSAASDHISSLNGATGGSGTGASGAFTNDELTAGRANTVYSQDRIACFGSGTGLTQTQMADLHSRIHTYLTAIGANY